RPPQPARGPPEPPPGQEDRGRQPPASERRLQEEKDPDHRDPPGDERALPGLLPLLVLTKQHRAVLQRELDAQERMSDVARDGAEIASAHVEPDVDAVRDR